VDQTDPSDREHEPTARMKETSQGRLVVMHGSSDSVLLVTNQNQNLVIARLWHLAVADSDVYPAMMMRQVGSTRSGGTVLGESDVAALREKDEAALEESDGAVLAEIHRVGLSGSDKTIWKCTRGNRFPRTRLIKTEIWYGKQEHQESQTGLPRVAKSKTNPVV
jgi:hypothetical protein